MSKRANHQVNKQQRQSASIAVCGGCGRTGGTMTRIQGEAGYIHLNSLSCNQMYLMRKQRAGQPSSSDGKLVKVTNPGIVQAVKESRI